MTLEKVHRAETANSKRNIRSSTIDKYTEAYAAYYPLVYSVVYTKTGDRDETRDICQEIFLILFEKFSTIENIRQWLLGTMRLVVLRHFQKKKNRNISIDDVFDDVKLTYTNGFRDTRIILTEAMENIACDEQERIILDLIATHNFTYKHVAELLGLTFRQVNYKYNQMVKKINDYLSEKGVKDIEELL
jgi:RNA polymerase sigma factor (sigma-70 family)